MLMINRQQELLEILRQEQSATVSSLARRLYASEPTVRRDLAALEAQGYLKRVHGGAVIGGAPDREIPYEVRAGEQEQAKAVMARRAAKFLHKGDVVFLDGSSSAAHMVEPLREVEDVLVVTSGARTALRLAECGVRVIATGGQMITRSFNLRRLMLERARVRVLLCDSSKFGKQYVYSLGYREEIDEVISEL